MTDIKILRGETIKTGDTKPSMRVKLMEDGEPFNLTDYTVNISIKLANSDSLTVDSSASIEADTRGIVEYSWDDGETDTAGTYLVEVIASDGTDEITFPNKGTSRLYIEERL